jgi:hypothetical protein
MVRMFSLSLATLGFFCLAWAEPAIVIKTPMPPPAWAVLERDLLRFNSEAVERFANKYVDDKGYLLHTIRWGTLDGPDDAIETFNNWTLLHALGGSDSVLNLYKKAQEGHGVNTPTCGRPLPSSRKTARTTKNSSPNPIGSTRVRDCEASSFSVCPIRTTASIATA